MLRNVGQKQAEAERRVNKLNFMQMNHSKVSGK